MKVTCQQCRGRGGYFTKIGRDSQPREHYVSCDNPGCSNGIVDLEKQHSILWGNPEAHLTKIEVGIY